MRVRPATPLSIIFLAAFALLLLSVLSTPIIPGIQLASHAGVTFGVFGYCGKANSSEPAPTKSAGGANSNGCSGFVVGYNMETIEPSNADFSLPSKARSSLTNLLIVHPIAAFFTLICLVLSILCHIQGPAHSPSYLLALLILCLPTFVLSLLAFLVDILIFLPHLAWGGWIVLGATVLIAIAGIVTCGMRRTLVSKVARRKRIQDNAAMNGTEYYAQNPPATVPPPGSVNGVGGDKLPEFATFEVDKPSRGEPEGERIPLNPRSRTVSPPLPEDRMFGGASAFNGPSLRRAPSDRSDGYGPPQRGAGPLSRPMPPGQVRNQYPNGAPQNGNSGPYGPPSQQRGYGGPPGNGYGPPGNGYGGPPGNGYGPPGNGYAGNRYSGEGPPGGYRGGPSPGNGPGMFNAAAGLTPSPRRGPGPGQGQGQGQFGPRGPPPPGAGGPYGGGGQYGMAPQGGMGPRGMGPDSGMGPRGMGPDNGMGPRGMGPDNGMGPRGMGPDNGMGSRGMGPDSGLGLQGGMMMGPGPGRRRSMPQSPQQQRGYEDEPMTDERREFEQTLPPAGGVGVATTIDNDDYREAYRDTPAEIGESLPREPTPRLSVVNETQSNVPYEDNEYVPPRVAWNGQTTGTPPPPEHNDPASPVELPAADMITSRATVVPRPSDSYYEDVAPAFDNTRMPNTRAHPAALTPGGTPMPPSLFPLQPPEQPVHQHHQHHQHQQHQQHHQHHQQTEAEALRDGQRSPAMSTTSNFTSISQRPLNPNWQPGYAPPMPAQRRGPTSSQLLGGNPDFELPGVGPRGRGGRGMGMGR